MSILKKFLIILLFAFMMLFFEGQVLKQILPSMFIPNTFLLIVIFLSFREVNILGLVFSFLLGLIYDISTSNLLGAYAASFTTIYTIFAIFSGRIFIDTTISLIIICAISSVICDIIYTILIYTFLPHIDNISFYMLFGGISTAICSPFVMYFLRRFYPVKSR